MYTVDGYTCKNENWVFSARLLNSTKRITLTFLNAIIRGLELHNMFENITYHISQLLFSLIATYSKVRHFICDKYNIYCEEDYNRKKACKCTYCKKPIAPKPGEKTVPRLRALGKDFHPDCFKCEVIIILFYEH